MVKRDDGDHVTIWVDNSYVEPGDDELDADDSNTDVSDVELARRQSLRILSVFSSGAATKEWCHGDSYVQDTGANAPFTGGANAIISWSNSCSGGWRAGIAEVRDLIVAGSNKGSNMHFRIEARWTIDGTVWSSIGCRDVGRFTRNARDLFQKNIGGWRVRARGEAYCELSGTSCVNNTCMPAVGNVPIKWWIGLFTGRV